MIREIKFYKTVNGKSPVEEFIDTLTAKQAQKKNMIIIGEKENE